MCANDFQEHEISDWQEREIALWENGLVQKGCPKVDPEVMKIRARLEAERRAVEEKQVAFNRKALQALIINFRKKAIQ